MKTSPTFEPIELSQIEREPLAHSYSTETTAYDKYDAPQSPKRRASTWRTRLSGWRGGVVACIAVTSSVLLLNITLAIIAATSWVGDGDTGITTAYQGDCTVAARSTTGLHLLVNILSSLLLGASNYCMQRLVAPTRKEIDTAHAKKKWLDIGMPSVRNLASISKVRVALWVLLGLSSMPLHFVYNSVIFETTAANDVKFLIVAPEFFTDKYSWNTTRGNETLNASTDNEFSRAQNSLLNGQYLDPTKFENITADECSLRYNTPFVESGTGFGVPIPSDLKMFGLGPLNSFRDFKQGSQDGHNINQDGADIEYAYCLSTIVPARCKVQFSQTILWVVIACNATKVILMTLILWCLDGQTQTIVTIGDAIQTFLRHPDPTTEGCCLMSHRNVEMLWKTPLLRSSQHYKGTPHHERWGYSCSRRRWGVTVFLCFAALATTGALFQVIRSTTTDDQNSFGKVDIKYLIDIKLPYSDSIVPYILLANLPQAVVSFIYLTYNGMFTCMLANREWSQYSIKRAPLRVTIPTATQRSTYFLQLPFTFSIPLLIASTLLHWFISQSIFLARIAMYNTDGEIIDINERLTAYRHMAVSQSGSVFTALGYSDAALIAVLSWGSALVLFLIVMANVMTYPKGVPVGGTCSAVISAACHVTRRREEGAAADGEAKGEDVASLPLKWGVTIRGGRDRIGHCSFSSGQVEKPVVGHLYAGEDKRRKLKTKKQTGKFL